MSIIDTDLSFLKSLRVEITGSWQESSRRAWRGCAISSEPVVALVISKVDKKIEWCKSERGNPDGQPVKLIMGHYDSENLDVQINYSIGGGHVCSRCITSTQRYKPELLIKRAMRAGVIEKVFQVEGSKTIELYALFLAASDVKVGRNGLWRIRDEYRDKLLSPFDEILAYGRNGELPDS